MHRPLRLLLPPVLLSILAFASGCGSSLAQPFEQMKGQPMTIYRLQNFEPPHAAAAVPGVAALPFQIPPQIDTWLKAGAAALPPGLIPPGLIPGIAPGQGAPAQDVARFHGFRILGWMAMNDAAQKGEVLDVLGHSSNFQSQHNNCTQLYAEFGFAIAQPNGAAPADVLVSLSCEQVQAFTIAWPYGNTGITQDAAKRIVTVVQKSFGG